MVGLNQIGVELFILSIIIMSKIYKQTNKKSREKNTKHQTFRLKKYIPKMLTNSF